MKSKPLKILMLGHCHSVFIHPFSKRIKEIFGAEISVLELSEPGSETRGLEWSIYSNVIKANSVRRSNISDIWNFVQVLWRRFSWRRIHSWFFKLDTESIQGLIRSDLNSWKRASIFKVAVRDYDLYHLHFVLPEFAEFLAAVPDSAPLVVSFWGGDLMDLGIAATLNQSEICERAQAITVRSYAMREILLSKFGRHLIGKIHIAKFGVGHFDQIDQCPRVDAVKRFRSRNNIKQGKIIVAIGHSGAQRNQHLLLLRQLKSCPKSLLDLITIVIPFTYNSSDGYEKILRAELALMDVQSILLKEYMSSSEVAEFRHATDILAFLPIEDALSGAMCETIYAGNIVITGSWLPYTEFWDKDIFVRRIEGIDKFSDALLETINRLPELKDKAAMNCKEVRNLVDYDRMIDQWVDVYNVVLPKSI